LVKDAFPDEDPVAFPVAFPDEDPVTFSDEGPVTFSVALLLTLPDEPKSIGAIQS
jgi:hypothetical protein